MVLFFISKSLLSGFKEEEEECDLKPGWLSIFFTINILVISDIYIYIYTILILICRVFVVVVVVSRRSVAGWLASVQ